MKLYRINKLHDRSGHVVKKRDVLAADDHQAIRTAIDSGECPVCDVWREGRRVGKIDRS